jgi:uncharacterized damage-inducible protein DinB
MEILNLDIHQQYAEIYDGDNWVGVSFCSAIDGVTPEMAFRQPPGNRNSIAAIVKHMTQWKLFVIQKLQGNANYDVNQDDSLNVSTLAADPTAGWRHLLEQMENSHEDLLEALEDLSPEDLDKQVGGRDYDVKYLINGVALHDMYHTGQIELLKKQLQFL